MTNENNKPALYTPGTTSMWNDPYISQQLLNVHLSDATDLASRKADTIERTIDWILEQCPEQTLDILDLGCGPGLYCKRLFQRGHTVSGIDLSENSIRYAKEQNSDVNYCVGNYCEDDLGENLYDLIILVFTDFGVLSPEERLKVLASVKKVLRPGGTFIFDVMSANCFGQSVAPSRTEEAESGFWRPTPYTCLSESIPYPEENVILSQHTVKEEGKEDTIYQFWTKYFTEPELVSLVEGAGFTLELISNSVIPDSDFYKESDVLFSVAKL